MHASIDWLNRYLDRPVDADEAERVLTAIGFPLDGIEHRDDDAVLDVEVTSNRPDVLCHVGVARELAAATGRTLQPPDVELPPGEGEAVESLTAVENRAADLCPVYTARVITGVTVGPSPDWLRKRVESIGLRSINNVVDVTNFVLHEMGQPLHAFDLAKLDGRRIIVRRADAGEPFTAIDGTQHKLTAGMLVIADARRPQAIAGVMGGTESEVGPDTRDVLLESAMFDPLGVRSTSRALKLASDSSYRFERGVDPEGVDRASRRAAAMIVEVAGGAIAAGVIVAGSAPTGARTVSMRPARCATLLGVELSTERMLALLGSLGLDPHAGGGRIACNVPSHRLDLQREADLIEEIARLHGYEQIGVEDRITIVARHPQRRVEARKALGRVLVAHGYHETITFSNLRTDHAEPFAEAVQVVTLNAEQKRAEPALRPSVLPSLLACRKANQDAGNADVRLFEVAQAFGRASGRFIETRRVAMLADAPDASVALRDVRGTIEELAATLAVRICIVESSPRPRWAAAAATIVLAGDTRRAIGAYGVASADLLKRFDLQTPVVLAEVEYEPLIAAYPPEPRVAPLPKYPAIERDLSIIVDEPTQWSAIEREIATAAPRCLVETRFIGVYRGKQVGGGRKSVTLRMTFRDVERTLEHDEVSEQVERAMARLRDHLKAELRAG